MSKICYNYESGEYENIDRDGFSYIQGAYVYYWDDSEYQEEEDYLQEEEERRWEEERRREEEQRWEEERRWEDEHQQNWY